MSKMPVFVFPISLDFYLGARHTHKQLLTLYNPYEFPIDFKVLCTSPNKFSVLEPEGCISPQSCVDLVVRYTQAARRPSSDKFRITMLDRGSHQVLGKRDVPVQLVEGEPPTSQSEPPAHTDDFLPLASRVNKQEDKANVCTHPAHREQQPVNIVAVAVSLCCIAALLLPTQPDPPAPSPLPVWLHIGHNLKLVFSFVLGLVAMLVLRP